MKRAMLAQIITSFLLLFAVPGCTMSVQDSTVKSLTGMVRVVGNEPFTRVVLTVDGAPGLAAGDRDYLIIGPLEKELRKSYQRKKLTLLGSFCVSPDPDFKKCFNPSKIDAGDKAPAGR